MSETNDIEQKRIELLDGHVTDEYLESIKNDGSADDNENPGDSGDGVDVVEALSSYDDETLNDTDEIEAEIEALQEKLDVVGAALPKSRRAEVRNTIKVLQAAAEAHSLFRTNTAEALAKRIEVSDL